MIRFATIGSNKIVDSFLAGAAHDPRFKHEVVYSRREDTGRAFAGRHGVEKVCTSLEELAARQDVDAVYIATPNICHAPQAIQMMQQGKHVLCEKPLAASCQEAEAMIATARRHGVSFMEAMKTTTLPNFKAVQAALPRIGKVRRYFAQFCQYSSRYDNFRKGIVMNAFRPELANGAMVDLGVYGLAPMVHLFGAPQTVSASETFLHTGVDGLGSIILGYPEMQAVVIYSKVSDSSIPSEIQGEDGRIVIDKLSTMIHPHLVYRDGREEDLSQPTVADDMYYEVAEFIDMIGSGRVESVTNTFERSLQVLRITDQVAAQRKKRPAIK